MSQLRLKSTLFAAALALVSSAADAAVIRVNNTTGSSAPYSSLSSAITASSAGDTIYVEGSAADYGNVTLSKRLTLIGSGYHLTESIPNPKTQANPNPSTIATLSFARGSKGSVVQGFSVAGAFVNDSMVTLQRNKLQGSVTIGNVNPVAFNTIRNNYCHSYITCNTANPINDLIVYNNIFLYQWIAEVIGPNINLANGYFINNTFPSGTNSFKCAGFVFQNNIFGSLPDFNGFVSSNSFFNNVSVSATGIPAGNGNVRGVTVSTLYIGSANGSTDGRYQLQAASPAIGAGLMNGTAVDCGAFGGPAPYILSGMPPIPSIYAMSAPTQVSQGTSTINVTFSTAAH